MPYKDENIVISVEDTPKAQAKCVSAFTIALVGETGGTRAKLIVASGTPRTNGDPERSNIPQK